jgi:hypothetical protein
MQQGKMMNENDQFIEETKPEENQLGRIARLGIDFIRLQNEIKQLENLLESRKKQFNFVSEVEIPDAMAQVKMREFSLTNGFRLKIKPVLVVSLPKEKVGEADAWLIENGHDGMMKHQIEIPLPKGIAQEDLNALKERIDSMGYAFTDSKSIHYQTLNKWAREMTEEGETIPEEIFKVFRGQKTEITGE